MIIVAISADMVGITLDACKIQTLVSKGPPIKKKRNNPFEKFFITLIFISKTFFFAIPC